MELSNLKTSDINAAVKDVLAGHPDSRAINDMFADANTTGVAKSLAYFRAYGELIDPNEFDKPSGVSSSLLSALAEKKADSNVSEAIKNTEEVEKRISGLPKADKIPSILQDGLTIQSDNVTQIDKIFINRGAWSTVLYVKADKDKDGKSKPLTAKIMRYQKRDGKFKEKSRFNINGKAQMLKVIEKLQYVVDTYGDRMAD